MGGIYRFVGTSHHTMCGYINKYCTDSRSVHLYEPIRWTMNGTMGKHMNYMDIWFGSDMGMI